MDRRRSIKQELLSLEEMLARSEQQGNFDRERVKKKLEALLSEELEVEKIIRTKKPTGEADARARAQLENVQELIAKYDDQIRVKDEMRSKESFEKRMRLDLVRQSLQDEDDRWARSSALRENLLAQLQSNLQTFQTAGQFPQIANMLNPHADDARVIRLETKLDQVMRELAELKQLLAKPQKE